MGVMTEGKFLLSREMRDLGDGFVEVTENLDVTRPDCPFIFTKWDDHGFYIEDKTLVKSASRTIIMRKRQL